MNTAGFNAHFQTFQLRIIWKIASKLLIRVPLKYEKRSIMFNEAKVKIIYSNCNGAGKKMVMVKRKTLQRKYKP